MTHWNRLVWIVAAGGVMLVGGIAKAQGRPFAFSVAFPDAPPVVVARYDAGYGEGTFEPLAGDRVQQTAEVDVSVGRLMVLASSGVALNGPAAVRGLAQMEAMVDALRFGGWHLAISGGVRRQFDGSTMLLSRLSVGKESPAWSLVANALVGTTVAGADADQHDAADYSASLGATARLLPGLSVGVETVASDLEGLWQSHEAEGGATIFAGPLASFTLPGHVARLTLSGGPILRTTGTGIPLYATTPGGVTVPLSSTHRTGYMLRTAVSVGL